MLVFYWAAGSLWSSSKFPRQRKTAKFWTVTVKKYYFMTSGRVYPKKSSIPKPNQRKEINDGHGYMRTARQRA
jgi:hypothetical protein